MIVSEIEDKVPAKSFPWEKFNISKNIKLADSQFQNPKSIDVLLAFSTTLSSLVIGQIKLGDSKPQLVLQKTYYGWIAAIDIEKMYRQFWVHLNDRKFQG